MHSTTLYTSSLLSTPTDFPFLLNPAYRYCENPMSSQPYDFSKEHTEGFTSLVSEAREDDPNQYINSSMLDIVTLKESPKKEAAHNIMAIAAESLTNEEVYFSSEYQMEEILRLKNARTAELLESLTREMFPEKPSDEPVPHPCKPTSVPPIPSKILRSS